MKKFKLEVLGQLLTSTLRKITVDYSDDNGSFKISTDFLLQIKIVPNIDFLILAHLAVYRFVYDSYSRSTGSTTFTACHLIDRPQ